jgi:hypothetical protein
MPSKTEEYLALAQRTANGLTRYWESWTDYLTTASRLYKYPFADQLMIYAQRPDATACADYDVWNNRMNRYVRRGAKGIALLDESSGFPRLHYVFDVSDTGVRRNSRDPEVWQYNDDLKQPVSEMLAATYGISGERVSQQLADVAGKLVADYWDNNGGDIRAIVDGSLLMDYDDAGVEMQFKSAAAMSVTYTLLERCGFEPAGWFDKDDFQAIYNFSTPDAVFALGAAVSDMSREVLRQIERTVKTTIRRRNNERSQYEYEQLPNLTLNQPRKPLGKYGRLRRTYLKDHRPVLYNTMLLNGSLYPHLMEVEQTAENRMQQTMAQLLKQNPAPDKEQNQMAWVQHMNSLKAQAEELVQNELIYS